MTKTIFYFTATGNSLQAALDIADGLGGAEVMSMTKAGMNVSCDSDVIGFVFPSFCWGPPNMAKEFIQSGSFRKDAYIFTVVTCGSSMGASPAIVDGLLRAKGAQLSYAAQLLSVSNYIGMYDVVPEKIEGTVAKADNDIKAIVSDLKSRKSRKIKRGIGLLPRIHRKFTAGYKTVDNDYNIADSCVGCGTCASVCPARNIKITEGKQVFRHNCEHCLACIHWCPNKAINYGNKTQKRNRYHHPRVKSSQLP